MTFHVPGIPAPQGSVKAYMPKCARFPVVTSDNPKTRPWRQDVRFAAQAAGATLLEGAVRVEVAYFFPRPKSHLTSKGALTKSAPRHHVCKPDLDKLDRAIRDALTGVCYVDDSQVVRSASRKEYGERIGADITVEAFS